MKELEAEFALMMCIRGSCVLSGLRQAMPIPTCIGWFSAIDPFSPHLQLVYIRHAIVGQASSPYSRCAGRMSVQRILE